jgi:hypothetical protein
MSTEFCQKCKQSHPGRACDYDDLGECAETVKIVPAETDPSSREVVAETEVSRNGPPEPIIRLAAAESGL